MECREVNERAIDRLTGQAGPEADRELEAHLASCSACRLEMSALEGVWQWLGGDPGMEPTAGFRRRTRALLAEEMMRAGVRQARSRSRSIRWLAEAAAVVVAAGLGFAAAKREIPPAGPSSPAAPEVALPDLGSNPRLSNVAYRPAGPDGKIGIAFDVTNHHEISGSPADPAVGKLLGYILSRNAETAGEKSRAIELLSRGYGTPALPASADLVAALTETLRRDSNPGVRKKAADALAAMPMTPVIRAAFLDALRGDRNPAVRLTAIDVLAAAARQSPDPRTIRSLREKAFDPSENGFVRAKAASALKTIEF